MQGGPPLTYADSDRLLQAFDVLVVKPEWAAYDNHPFNVSISIGADVKVTFAIEKTTHEAFTLESGPVTLHGTAYLARILDAEDAREALDQARDAHESDLNAKVPGNLHETFRSGALEATVTILDQVPELTFNDLRLILIDLEFHLGDYQRWIAVESWITYDEEGIIDDVGSICLIESSPHHSVSASNISQDIEVMKVS